MPGMLGNLTNMVRDWFIQDKLFVGPGAGPSQPGDPAGTIYSTGPTFSTWYGARAHLTSNFQPTSSPQRIPFTTITDSFGMISGSGTASFQFTIPRTGQWEISFVNLMTASAAVTTAGFAGIQLSIGGTLEMQALQSWNVGDPATGFYRVASATAVFPCTAGQAITASAAYNMAPAPIFHADQPYDTVITITYFGT